MRLCRVDDSSMSFWACSRLFQKDSPAIKESSSLRRLCALATSKKPPQLGGPLGGGVNLGANRFKHGGRKAAKGTVEGQEVL